MQNVDEDNLPGRYRYCPTEFRVCRTSAAAHLELVGVRIGKLLSQELGEYLLLRQRINQGDVIFECTVNNFIFREKKLLFISIMILVSILTNNDSVESTGHTQRVFCRLFENHGVEIFFRDGIRLEIYLIKLGNN